MKVWFIGPLLLCCGIICLQAQSGGQRADSSLSGVLFKMTYAVQFPQADLGNRFGTFSNISLAAHYKTSSNWQFGMRGDFMFGNKVKEPYLLEGIKNSNGAVISQTGEQVIVSTEARGFTVMLSFTRMFPVTKQDKNSGLLLEAEGGLLRHKIRFDWRNYQLPLLEKEYLKGYDRLSLGPAGRLFLGYQYLGKKQVRWLNFYAGGEVIYARTKSLRQFNYDTGLYDIQPRTDWLWGIRAGYILPVLRYPPDDFYYY